MLKMIRRHLKVMDGCFVQVVHSFSPHDSKDRPKPPVNSMYLLKMNGLMSAEVQNKNDHVCGYYEFYIKTQMVQDRDFWQLEVWL